MNFIAVVLIFIVLAILVMGIVLMAIGGETNKKYSNLLMTLRVVFQFIAIILLALMFFVAKKS